MDIDFEKYPPDRLAESVSDRPRENEDSVVPSAATSLVRTADADTDTEHSEKVDEAPKDSPRVETDSIHGTAHAYAISPAHSESTTWTAAIRKRTSQPHPRLPFLQEICAIELPNRCPVFDDCDTVRAKLRAFFDKGALSKAAWLKQHRVNSNSLRTFYLRSGPTDGSTQGVYEVAYWFLERYRLYQNNPKSPRRLQNEKDHPYGFPHARFVLHPGKGRWRSQRKPAEPTEPGPRAEMASMSPARDQTDGESDQGTTDEDRRSTSEWITSTESNVVPPFRYFIKRPMLVQN